MSSPEPFPNSRRRVAIVGGGISGIACSWELRKHDCIVDIYEAEDRLGGHANSVKFSGNGKSVDVDTGFVVMDESTYPHFHEFLMELGVRTIPTDMSFGVSTSDEAGIEWSSSSVWGFVQKLSNLFSFGFWRLVLGMIWFSIFAEDILEEPSISEDDKHCDILVETADGLSRPARYETIGSYLRRKGYSASFITYALIPMIASPWCADPEEFAQTFPAKLIIQFMLEHGLLDTIMDKLSWRSFRNGSKTYVDAFQKRMSSQHQIHLNAAVHQVVRTHDGVALGFANGTSKCYDHVVLAIHANQALNLLGKDATALEHKILSSFKTTRNVCVLHSDISLLPRSPTACAAWNCFLDTNHSCAEYNSQDECFKPLCKSVSRMSVTFDINRLQGIPFPGTPDSPGRILVTMNPHRIPRFQQGSYEYYHPLISSDSVNMSHHMHMINGVDKVSFAGAWMGFGFHEDGFNAGVHAARLFVYGFETAGKLDLFSPTKRQPKRRFCLEPASLHSTLYISFHINDLAPHGISGTTDILF
ncbi:FAD/NAD(P)-binding domain-containing protein [Nemania abortiva]|nr:FAD/NAD(P)-binding domain-containing protein [Nemania abortiva]